MIYAFMRWLMRSLTRTFLLGLFEVVGAENVPTDAMKYVDSSLVAKTLNV